MGLIKKLIRKTQFSIRDKTINKKNRSLIKNKNCTIICNDCLAGCIYHDLLLRFNSPTINLFFPASDYIVYLSRLKEFLENYRIEPLDELYQDHPVAKIVLEDGTAVKVYLLHYDSVEVFREKYSTRALRVNWENLFVVFNDRNGCTAQDIINFDKMPFERKICFVHKKTDGINCQYVIPNCEKYTEVKPLMDYIHLLGIKRHYDNFDYVSWLNEGELKP